MAGAILDTRAGSDSSTCMEPEKPPLEFEPWSEGRLELILIWECIGLLLAVLAGIVDPVGAVGGGGGFRGDRFGCFLCLSCLWGPVGGGCFFFVASVV